MTDIDTLIKKDYTLYFIRIPPPGAQKTWRWVLRKDDSKGLAQLLGVVHWRWHQYVFRADREVDMSPGCQDFVSKFMRYQTDWYRKHAHR